MPKDDLDALIQKLKGIDKLVDLITTSVAEEALGLIAEGFRTETDPYGRKWAPKQDKDGRKALSGRTSRLKNGWKITRQSDGEVRISTSVDYAQYHQSGTGIYGPKGARIVATNARALSWTNAKGKRVTRFSVDGAPRRMMIPDPSMGMPPEWEKQLAEAATDAFEAFFRGDASPLAAEIRRRAGGNLVGFKVG